MRIVLETWAHNDADTSYLVFGAFRKGKVHCSCAMCAAKTNGKLNKSRGRVYNPPVLTGPDDPKRFAAYRGCRLSTTNERYGKKHYPIPDKKRIDEMRGQIKEYIGA